MPGIQNYKRAEEYITSKVSWPNIKAKITKIANRTLQAYTPSLLHIYLAPACSTAAKAHTGFGLKDRNTFHTHLACEKKKLRGCFISLYRFVSIYLLDSTGCPSLPTALSQIMPNLVDQGDQAREQQEARQAMHFQEAEKRTLCKTKNSMRSTRMLDGCSPRIICPILWVYSVMR